MFGMDFFDLDGDGITSLSEEFLAYKSFEYCTKDDDDDDDFDDDDDDF